MIYRKKTGKSPVKAFVLYCRDLFVHLIPCKHLPGFLVKALYGMEPDFLFLVHPRRSEDIFVALPYLALLRKVFPKKTALRIMKYLPPFVLDRLVGPSGVNGMVISSLFLPEFLMEGKKNTLKEYYKILRFAAKISPSKVYMGLGAWWPIVTRRGLAMRAEAADMGIQVTNGHTGTLLSLYLMIRKLSLLADIEMDDLRVAIIGAGKMGTNVGKVLVREVDKVGVVDINSKRLERFFNSVGGNKEKVITVLREDDTVLSRILDDYHFAICVTSNARRIIKEDEIPADFIVIDDSRPEAISRDNADRSKVILEGGLIRIPGIRISYDYGFGKGENVFGCLAESYSLAMDNGRSLDTTLGDVDLKNFDTLVEFCEQNGIMMGDFKTRDKHINERGLKQILKRRNARIEKKIEQDRSRHRGSIV